MPLLVPAKVGCGVLNDVDTELPPAVTVFVGCGVVVEFDPIDDELLPVNVGIGVVVLLEKGGLLVAFPLLEPLPVNVGIGVVVLPEKGGLLVTFPLLELLPENVGIRVVVELLPPVKLGWGVNAVGNGVPTGGIDPMMPRFAEGLSVIPNGAGVGLKN